jgi:hypothetical protein
MTRGRARSIYVSVGFVAWMVISPLVVYVAQANSGATSVTLSAWSLVGVTGMYVLVERFAVRLSIGECNINYVLTEFPLLLGAIFVNPVAHIAVRFVANGAATMWRVRRNPAVPTIKAGLTNGSNGAAQTAAFVAVTTAFHWRNTYDVRGGVVLALAWGAYTMVDLCVPIVGRAIAGQRISRDGTRSAVVDAINLSVPSMLIAVLLARGGSIVQGLLLLVPLVLVCRHGGPVVRQLAEGQTYKALHNFFRLLEKTTPDNIETAVELAATATKTRQRAYY